MAMADDNSELSRILASEPAGWWNSLGDDMREKAKKGQLELMGDFARFAPLAALMGLRGSPARGSMRAFNPNAPTAPLPRRPDGGSVSQAVYEAALGRPPGGGPGSGHTAGGWPKSPLAYLLAGGGGYGIYNALGGADAMDQLQKLNTPGTPEYEAERLRKIAVHEQYGAEKDESAKASPTRAMYEYGGANWPWDIDKYGGRKKDPGIPPLPDVPY